jgi:hypothetical protein
VAQFRGETVAASCAAEATLVLVASVVPKRSSRAVGMSPSWCQQAQPCDGGISSGASCAGSGRLWSPIFDGYRNPADLSRFS